MKVLHVTTWKVRCGIAGYAESLVKSLDELGVESRPFSRSSRMTFTR